MSYVTPSYVKSVVDNSFLIEATNVNDSAATTINETRLADACEAANGYADGYLIRKFRLPLDTSNALIPALKIHCTNLAMEILGAIVGATEEQIRRADLAREWLELITDPDEGADGGASGDFSPGVDEDELANLSSQETDYTWSRTSVGNLQLEPTTNFSLY